MRWRGFMFFSSWWVAGAFVVFYTNLDKFGGFLIGVCCWVLPKVMTDVKWQWGDKLW